MPHINFSLLTDRSVVSLHGCCRKLTTRKYVGNCPDGETVVVHREDKGNESNRSDLALPPGPERVTRCDALSLDAPVAPELSAGVAVVQPTPEAVVVDLTEDTTRRIGE